jgi:hypothetical protein
MRLKSAALFAGLLFVSFCLHGGARCQSSPPLSLAPPPSVTDQGSPPAGCYWSGLHLWCSKPASPDVLSPRPTAKGSPPPPTTAPEVPMYPPPVIVAPPTSATAKGSPPPAVKNVSPPKATDDVPAPTATAKRSARSAVKNVSPPMATDDVPVPTATAKGSPPPAAKNVSPPMATDDVPAPTATAKRSARSAAATNSPPPANDKDAPAPAIDNILPTPGIDNLLPTPRIGKLSPSQEPAADYDGFTVGIDDGEETGQPLPIRPRPAKQSKVRQKPDTTEGPSAIQSLDDAEIEKLKPKLTICRGC